MPLAAAILLILVPLLALTIILVIATGRADHQVRANDNVATAAIRLIGGAFIFMSAFATVALWQESSRLADTVGQEFGHASIVMDGELMNPRISSSNDGANEQVFEATRGIFAGCRTVTPETPKVVSLHARTSDSPSATSLVLVRGDSAATLINS